MSITSVVTPSANPRRANGKATLKSSAAMPNINGPVTLDAAIETFFEYGSSMAGMDGNIVRALKAFASDSKEDKAARTQMFKAMDEGALVRKLNVTRDEAAVITGLAKFHPDHIDDKHRTKEQQRVIDTGRMMKSRAMKLAGISDQTEAQRQALANAQQTREQKKQEAEKRESELLQSHEILHPADETDPIDALTRVALQLKAMQKKYALKLKGDIGSAWRNWIDAAPMGTKTPSSKKK